MKKMLGTISLGIIIGLTAQVGRIDFAEKYEEWRLGDPNKITYADFNALIEDAQASDVGLENILAVINLADLKVDRLFTYTDASAREWVTTPLVMAILAKLPKLVDQLLARGASLTLQSAWRIPFAKILQTKDELTLNIVIKSRGLQGKKLTEAEVTGLTTNLMVQERVEVDRLAPPLVKAKIIEYTPIIDVIKKHAQDRNDATIIEGIQDYQQKFNLIMSGAKGTYSADASGSLV